MLPYKDNIILALIHFLIINFVPLMKLYNFPVINLNFFVKTMDNLIENTPSSIIDYRLITTFEELTGNELKLLVFMSLYANEKGIITLNSGYLTAYSDLIGSTSASQSNCLGALVRKRIITKLGIGIYEINIKGINNQKTINYERPN